MKGFACLLLALASIHYVSESVECFETGRNIPAIIKFLLGTAAIIGGISFVKFVG